MGATRRPSEVTIRLATTLPRLIPRSAPARDQVEVTVLGTGRGECILVHLGRNEWIIVDSLGRKRPEHPALAYLDTLGVPAEAVQLIVATHWHDDHIRRLDYLVDRCTEAQLVLSTALANDELLVGLGSYPRLNRGGSTNGVELMARALANAEKRYDQRIAAGQTPPYPLKPAGADTLLLERDALAGVPSVRVYAISPSPKTQIEAARELARIIAELVANGTAIVPRPPRNPMSVALHIEVGDCTVLLGADLEYENDVACGWRAVLECAGRSRPAEVVKAAHHGAASGHDETVWPQLVIDDPIVLIAPWRGANGPLPSTEDLKRLRADSSTVLLSAPPHRPQAVVGADGRRRRPNSAPGRTTVRRTVSTTTQPLTTRAEGWLCELVDPGKQQP